MILNNGLKLIQNNNVCPIFLELCDVEDVQNENPHSSAMGIFILRDSN